MIRTAILASLIAAAFAHAEPLVKPVVPPSGFTRVTYPLTVGEEFGNAYAVAGFVAPGKPGKDKTSPGTPVKVAFCSAIDPLITVATLKAWGYTAEPGKMFTLPSLTLVGEAKLQGKPATVHVKLSNLQLFVAKSAYGSESSVRGADLMIGLNQALLATHAQSEMWMTFGDGATLQVNYPAAAVKRIGTAEPREMPEPPVPDANRVPLRISLTPTDYATPLTSFHGQPAKATGKVCHLDVSMTEKDYIYLTYPMALSYGIKADESNATVGRGADSEAKLFNGISKDIRLPASSGAGYKAVLDLNLKQVAVTIDAESLNHTLMVGPGYLKSIVQSPLLAVGTDGIPRLYGYIEKANTLDPKAKK